MPEQRIPEQKIPKAKELAAAGAEAVAAELDDEAALRAAFDIGVAGEHLTGEEFAAAFSESCRERAAYQPLSFDKFRAQAFPSAGEVGNMFEYYYLAEAEFTGSRDLDLVRALILQLQTFRSWRRSQPVLPQ